MSTVNTEQINFDDIPDNFRLMLHDDRISLENETYFFADIFSVVKVIEKRTLSGYFINFISALFLLILFATVIDSYSHHISWWWYPVILYFIIAFFKCISVGNESRKFYLILNTRLGAEKIYLYEHDGVEYGAKKARLYIDVLARELHKRLSSFPRSNVGGQK